MDEQGRIVLETVRDGDDEDGAVHLKSILYQSSQHRCQCTSSVGTGTVQGDRTGTLIPPIRNLTRPTQRYAPCYSSDRVFPSHLAMFSQVEAPLRAGRQHSKARS